MIFRKSTLIILFVLLPDLLTDEKADQKYNEIFSIACHNCFLPQNAPSIEDVLKYTSNIELDIWDNKIGSGFLGVGKISNHWFVKHDGWENGNVNCCGGSLNECLSRLKLWSNAHLKHRVITVFLDKKENWGDSGEKRGPEDLDSLLFSIFADKLVTPKTLMSTTFNSLRQMSKENAWPALATLQQKFLFVITDGTEFTKRKPLDEYLTSRANAARCLVAPEIVNFNSISVPDNFTPSNVQNIVMFNLNHISKDLCPTISQLNFMSRIYGASENRKTLSELISKKANFIAFSNYKLALE
ncbi:MAG: hypothetical protein EOO20_16210 [Chryseobacterium sp.]|nr:MAG: hypothetical protein EOO20_16210 [Chryseobacterium sp.]